MNLSRALLFALSFIVTSTLTLHVRAQHLPVVEPSEVGLRDEALRPIETIVNTAIADQKMPGCVICVGRHGKVAYLKAFGNRQVQPTEFRMQTDTVFDLASLTKPVATATSIMRLLDQGKLKLSDHVSDYFPEFGVNGKDEITIQHLLIHQSGLTPDNALSDYLDGPEKAWQRICDLKLTAPVGEVFKYSDVNFIVLGKLVEKLSGKSLDVYVNEEIFAPLGMSETGFNPSADLASRAATTEKRSGTWIQGTVHDPRAYELNGVAGHAGLFSTAQDLAVYAHMMLNQGALNNNENGLVSIFSPETFELMTSDYEVSGGIRGLGWDKQTGFSSNKGSKLSSAAFGHGGFTGTVLWIDPKRDLFFVFLSNRVHPSGNGSVNRLAGEIADYIVDAIETDSSDVKFGIDAIRDRNFQVLQGKKVGLITNHTGKDSAGQSTVNILSSAKEVQLAALFSPEHGFDGDLDISKIADSTDQSTGLKIFSLYGENRKPTEQMLSDLDVLVFDIQDIGTRFYTYVSTMGEAMKAAAEHGKSFVVLDRPNPIGGTTISGPMLDPGKESFVGYHSLPVRHGMTTGELALMFKDELGLSLDLHIIPCEGWKREMTWDETSLTWVNPSPNMRSLTQAFLYPGVGLLEMTNLSVGRGTDTPFEVIGAPWIKARQLAKALNAKNLPGVAFVPINFTPSSSKFAGESCGGINVIITDRAAFDSVKTGLWIAVTLRALYPDDWQTKQYNRLLCCDEVWKAVVDVQALDVVAEKAEIGLKEFEDRRKKYLLY